MKFTLVHKESGKKSQFGYICVGWTNVEQNILAQFRARFPKVEDVSEVEARVYFKDFEYPLNEQIQSIFAHESVRNQFKLSPEDDLVASRADIIDWHQSLLRRSLFRKHIKEDEGGEYFVINTSRISTDGRNLDYPLNCVIAAHIRNPTDYPGGVWSFYYKTLGSRKSATLLLVACSFHHGNLMSHSTFMPRERFFSVFSKTGKGMEVIRKLMKGLEKRYVYPAEYFTEELPVPKTATPIPRAGDLDEILKYLKGA